MYLPWRIFVILLVLKISYLLVIYIVLNFYSDPDFERLVSLHLHWPREGDLVRGSHFATWDSAHYLFLSEVGYVKGVPSCAFYPLWPILVRWLSFLMNNNHLIAGLLLANVCSISAWILFYRMVVKRWGEFVAIWSLSFLILFPGSLFFQFHYTESLFLLLIMVFWRGLEENSYDWAWVGSLFLALTRGIGVFAVLPIAFHALQALKTWHKQHGQNATDATSKIKFPFRPVLLLTAPLISWTAYLTLMWYWTGNAFEGFDAQKHWRVHSIGNLWNLSKFMIGLFTPTQWHEFTGSILDRCVFLLLCNCIVIIWRLDKGLLVWVYVLGILPAMSGTFTSFTRFASCVFPMFIALGVYFSKPERKIAGWILLIIFGILHVVLVWRFVNFRWAG